MNLKQIIRESVRQYINENIDNNYIIVYRGQDSKHKQISPSNSIWVTNDYEFAKEYGNVKEYKLPKNLNILDTDYYSEWENLVNEFDEDGDYDEYKYEPTNDFISFLNSKGYHGFMNGRNFLIFDKTLLKPIE